MILAAELLLLGSFIPCLAIPPNVSNILLMKNLCEWAKLLQSNYCVLFRFCDYILRNDHCMPTCTHKLFDARKTSNFSCMHGHIRHTPHTTHHTHHTYRTWLRQLLVCGHQIKLQQLNLPQILLLLGHDLVKSLASHAELCLWDTLDYLPQQLLNIMVCTHAPIQLKRSVSWMAVHHDNDICFTITPVWGVCMCAWMKLIIIKKWSVGICIFSA